MMQNIHPSGITVDDLMMRGVEVVRASCQCCGESWTAPITFLPSATTLEKISQLMICPLCGGRDIVAQPVWLGEAPRVN